MAKTNQANRETDLLLVDVRTVSGMLGRCERQIWRDALAGRIPPPIVLGGARKWNLRNLKRWVRQGCPPCKTSIEPAVVLDEQQGQRAAESVLQPDATAAAKKRSPEEFRRWLAAAERLSADTPRPM